MTFRDRYLEALGLSDKDELRKVRKRAYDIRQFEIELYWKRATYFWAFQLVAFAMLGLLFRDGELKNPQLLTIPASIGVITAFAGILTARGSKFWQENWEAHVDLLEGETEERLTQVVMCRRPPQYSVSRVNESLLRLFTIAWFVVLLFSAIPRPTAISTVIAHYQGICILLAVIVACRWMWISTRTEFTGRMYQFGTEHWQEYSPAHTVREPFIIWRDPLSEMRARVPESSSEGQAGPESKA